jgi:hypothetical protein
MRIRRESKRKLALPAALFVAWLLVAPAQAMSAQRYASQTGTGTTCSQATPCDIVEAVGFAGAADEIIVNAGTYDLNSQTLPVTGSQNMHGAVGEAIPQLNFSNPPSQALSLSGMATAARLRIAVTASRGVALFAGTTAEQLFVQASGSGQVACAVGLAVLRDSVCNASAVDGEGLIASGDGTVTLRNLTVHGGALGLDAFAGTMDEDLVVEVKNSVFQGGTIADIAAYPLGPSSTVAVNLTNSNYDSEHEDNLNGTVTNPGTDSNQTAAPLFVNPGTDFRQQAASPTRNAGAPDSQLGALDFEGDPRSQGSAPDIGADEYDDTAPQTTISTGPPAKSKKRKASFGFSADDPGASFECKLDQGAFAPCSAPKAYKKLRPGKHTFQVRGTDALGNVDATPATRSWKVKKKKKKKRKRR